MERRKTPDYFGLSIFFKIKRNIIIRSRGHTPTLQQILSVIMKYYFNISVKVDQNEHFHMCFHILFVNEHSKNKWLLLSITLLQNTETLSPIKPHCSCLAQQSVDNLSFKANHPTNKAKPGD